MRITGGYLIPGPASTRSSMPNASLIGGKGTGLYLLAGIPDIKVSPFFVLSTDAFRQCVSGRHPITDILKRLDDRSRAWVRAYLSDSQKALESTGADIVDLANKLQRKLDASLLPGGADIILRAFADRQHIGFPVSVRSSAIGEDSIFSSFSGAYETRLNVGRSGLAEAVIAVWRSLYRPDAVTERNRVSAFEIAMRALASGRDFRGADADDLPFSNSRSMMAAVIQQMVDSSAAGTCHNIRASDRKTGTHFELSETGSMVVDGDTVPKLRLFIDKDGKPQSDLPGTELIDMSGIFEIRRQAQKVFERATAFYGYPFIDTELAVERKSGQVYFLQARPYFISSLDLPLEMNNELPCIYTGGLPIVTKPASGRLLVGSSSIEAEEKKLKSLAKKGDILVTDKFHVNWGNVELSGIVTEQGGTTSHAANVAKENGVPCIVGAVDAVYSLYRYQGQTVTLWPQKASIYLGIGDFSPAGTKTKALDGRGNTNIANARPDQMIEGRGYFGKPRFPLKGFQFRVYKEAFKRMNVLLGDHFNAPYISSVLVDRPEGVTIYAPQDDFNRACDVIRNVPLGNIEEWLEQRKKDSRAFFDFCETFDPASSGKLFDIYSAAVAHFHLRGTILHALEGRSLEILEDRGIASEAFISFRNCIFGRGRTIESRSYRDDHMCLVRKSKEHAAFLKGLSAEGVIKALRNDNDPLVNDLIVFSRSYNIANTEDIRLDGDVVLQKVVEQIMRDLSQPAEIVPPNNYMPFNELKEILDKFPGKKEREEFLRFARLMFELNFENEFEHHRQVRAQWRLVARGLNNLL